MVHANPRPIPTFRIINGAVALPHSHPYQVGIYATGKQQSQFCGGWGITSNSQRTVTPLLHEVGMTIMSNQECAAVSASYKAFMKPNLLCTSGLENGVKVGFCKGDSGGPLVVGKDPDSWLQVGVVSFGQSDCEKGLPAVFERVTRYLEWVKMNSDVVNHGIYQYFSTKPEVKIINGEVCTPHCMPFIVGINLETTYGSDFCAGSLISPNYVLTAAHCLES
nr:unnamed protein product [Callosobruchus chinensis]